MNGNDLKLTVAVQMQLFLPFDSMVNLLLSMKRDQGNRGLYSISLSVTILVYIDLNLCI